MLFFAYFGADTNIIFDDNFVALVIAFVFF